MANYNLNPLSWHVFLNFYEGSTFQAFFPQNLIPTNPRKYILLLSPILKNKLRLKKMK
jgi:hypothetical protein